MRVNEEKASLTWQKHNWRTILEHTIYRLVHVEMNSLLILSLAKAACWQKRGASTADLRLPVPSSHCLHCQNYLIPKSVQLYPSTVIYKSISQKLTFAWPHTGRIMFLVGVFAATFGSPGTGIEIATSLEPELANLFWTGRDPGKRRTTASRYFTRHPNAATWIEKNNDFYLLTSHRNTTCSLPFSFTIQPKLRERAFLSLPWSAPFIYTLRYYQGSHIKKQSIQLVKVLQVTDTLYRYLGWLYYM